MKTGLKCKNILLSSGWHSDITLEFNAEGIICNIRNSYPNENFPIAPGPVIPGLPNVHSHSFQRAMAGLTECIGPGGDDFWSWRQMVYKLSLIHI